MPHILLLIDIILYLNHIHTFMRIVGRKFLALIMIYALAKTQWGSRCRTTLRMRNSGFIQHWQTVPD